MATTTVQRQWQPSEQESLSPQQLREWAIWCGSPSGGASRARAGGAGASGPRTRRREPLSSQQLRKTAVRWGSPGGGAWCAATGGPCESTPASSAAGRRKAFGGGQQWQQRPQQLPSIGAEPEEALHPGSGLYTLTTESAQVGESGQVAASVEVAASCSCRLLTHQTLRWHHCLRHPSLPRLRGMHSRLLVSGLPRSMPPLPRSFACLPCIEGRQRAAPHSSFPPTIAPLQILRMDVWGPARVPGQGGERYFLLVVDEYTRYTTVFPLQSKAKVRMLVFSRTSWSYDSTLTEAAAPHFLWSFAVRYAAEKLNPWLCVSHPETSPTLRWTGEVGDASPFRGPTPSGVSQVDPSPLVEADEVSSDTSGPAEGGDPTPAATRTPCRSARLAVPPGFPPRPSSPLLQPVAVDSGVAGGGTTGSAGSGGAESPLGTGGAAAGSPCSRRQESLSPHRLRGWAVHWGSPGGGTGSAGAACSGGAGPEGASAGVPGTGGAGAAGGTGGTGPGGASSGVLGVGRTGGTGTEGGADTGGTLGGSEGAGVSGATGCTGFGGAVATGAGGFGGATTQPQPSALRHLLSLLPAATEFPIAAHVRRIRRPRAPVVPGTHDMTLRPSSVPQHVVLPSPPASSLPHVPDPGSDLVRSASPTVTRLLATVVTDPSFESAVAFALVAELVDFATLCCLDYATSLVLYSSCPPSVMGELALGSDILEDRQFELDCLAAAAPHLESTLLCPEGDTDALDIPTPHTYAEAITGPYSSQWQIAMDAEMAS
ncbi:unnamed protein product [Closterium sp. NIES-54]